MTDPIIEQVSIEVPTAMVEVYGSIPGAPGPQGDAGPAGFSTVVNALDHGVTGAGSTDDTTAIKDLFDLPGWPYPLSFYFPGSVVGYRVSDTLAIPKSSAVSGVGWQGTRFYPVAGMNVPVFDLGTEGGVSLGDVAIWSLGGSGHAGTPAVVMGGQQQKVFNLDIRSQAGRGVDVTVQNFSTLRNVNVSSCGEDGFTVATTYTLLDGCTSNGNGGHGFVLKDSLYANGSGALVGCVSEGNAGHGYYVIGGDWELSVYGEANGGYLLYVDGTQQFDTSVTLASPATAGDTTITVNGLSKGLPAKSILRFEDGSVAIIDNNQPGPVVSLVVAIKTDQDAGAVATLAPEDIHPSRLPTVRLRAGTHDGPIYLHACNYSLDSANFPISSTITATESARMVGEAYVKGRSNTVFTNWGGGGSKAIAAVTGSVQPVITEGLYHTANPTNQYFLWGDPTVTCVPDSTVPGGFYHRLANQFELIYTSQNWNLSSLSVGDWSIRLLVRDAGMTANNIEIILTGGSDTLHTTKTTGWEWISLDYTQTAASKLAATGPIAIERKTVTSNVDVAAIIFVPKQSHVVLPGNWKSPTMVGSNAAVAMWTDSDGALRFNNVLPTSDTNSDFAIADPKTVLVGTTKIVSGSGSPESSVTAPIGSLFQRTDGSVGTSLYLKDAGTGNTGWIPLGAPTGLYSGTGSPNGAVTAPVGSIYQRTDGGVGTSLYIKETGSGNTGWSVVATPGASTGCQSFRMLYSDIPNNYGSTSWTFLPVPSVGPFGLSPPYFGGYQQSAAGTGVEELSFDVFMDAGTWSFEAYYVGLTNTGKFTVLIDSTESSSVDTYDSGHVLHSTVLAGTSVTAGVHTMKIRKKGTKNASASDYYILWSGLYGYRTGP